MARAYQPQPWSSGPGLSFESGPDPDSRTPERRRMVSSGVTPPLGVRINEEYAAHRSYYRFLVGAGVFVLIIIGLVVYSGLKK